MTTYIRTGARLAAVTLLTAGVLGSTGAQASASPADTRTYSLDKRHCMTVVAPAAAEATASEVLSHGCYRTKKELDRAVSADRAAEVRLSVWAEHANMAGIYDVIYGPAPCDGTGYWLTASSWWKVRLSSFSNESGCNNSFLTGDRGNGTFGSHANWVGSTLDNAVNRMRIWR
ncbi:hypothetical protein [Streptomyces clavuligerus]|nr:hypothetical protein [Streptomyces clavuligerus]WDN56653.1 hypothetical protein LL058_33070 [Streptomyces clavuligerus]